MYKNIEFLITYKTYNNDSFPLNIYEYKIMMIIVGWWGRVGGRGQDRGWEKTMTSTHQT